MRERERERARGVEIKIGLLAGYNFSDPASIAVHIKICSTFRQSSKYIFPPHDSYHNIFMTSVQPSNQALGEYYIKILWLIQLIMFARTDKHACSHMKTN